eukprot:scaffold202439_cov28-Tisochrysis_lutea.AAC.2
MLRLLFLSWLLTRSGQVCIPALWQAPELKRDVHMPCGRHGRMECRVINTYVCMEDREMYGKGYKGREGIGLQPNTYR